MAATYSLFVTTQYIKNNSPVIGYVADDELQPFIRVAQETTIQKTIGTNLLRDLQNKVLNNSLNTAEVKLFEEYLQPATCWATCYEYLLFSHYKFTNKGINKQFSDGSVAADLNEVNFVRDDVRNKMEYFKDRMYKHLLSFMTDFPLFYGGNILPENIVPSYNNYYSGIYTGSRRGRGSCPGEPRPGDWPTLDWN